MNLKTTDYTFDCGCKVTCLDDTIKNYDQLPALEIPYNLMTETLNYNTGCPKVWELLGRGKAKGVFQLESNLGQGWAKKVEPTSLEEMSALISLLRPGCLKAIMDGKSMTMHYVDRKHGRDEVTYLTDELKQFLEPTYGVLTYQEQTLRIVQVLGGFTEEEADILRRGLGKKKAEVVAKIRKQFVEGCLKVGKVNEEEANQIYDWIEKGNRYLFNKSHGVAYGSIGYLTAWVKVHFPLHFYCSWMTYARAKAKAQQEVKDLVKDARSLGNDVFTPTIDSLFANDADVCIDVDNITFGIRSVKSLGKAAVEQFIKQIKDAEAACGKTVSEMSWVEFMAHLGGSIKKTSIINLISVGMFDCFGLARQRMLYEYNACYSKGGITKLEAKKMLPWASQFDKMSDLISYFANIEDTKQGPANKNRREKLLQIVESIKSPPYDIDHDDPKWIMTQEIDLLGAALTFSAVDTVDSPPSNMTCKEFEDGGGKDNIVLAVEVVSSRPYMCKNDKEMGFATLEDNTGTVDAVIFTDEWEEYSHLFFEGSLIACIGKRSDRGDSFQIQKVFEI